MVYKYHFIIWYNDIYQNGTLFFPIEWDSLFILVFDSSEFSQIILRTHNYRSHCFKAVSHNVDFCILGYAEGCRGNREPSVVIWESGRLSVTDLISDQSTGCCCDLMKGLISQGPK